MDRAAKRTDPLREREEEATEKETLKDLEDSFGGSDSEESDDENVPSPDGSIDERNEEEQPGQMLHH
jgi:hypothetical protein